MTKGEVESLRPHPRAPIYLDINQSTTTHYQTHSILTSQVKTYQHGSYIDLLFSLLLSRILSTYVLLSTSFVIHPDRVTASFNVSP